MGKRNKKPLVTGPQTNPEIRRQARRRYAQKPWPLLGLALLSLLLTALPTLAALLLRITWGPALELGCAVVLYPLSVGITAYFLSSYRAGEAAARSVVDWYRTPRLLGTALLAGLFPLLFRALSVGLSYLYKAPMPKDGRANTALAMGFLLLWAVGHIAVFCLQLRLFLLPYVLIRAPGLSPWAAVALCWQRTRRTVLVQIGFTITLYWIVFLASIVTYFFALGAAAWTPLQANLFFYVALLPFQPYFLLAYAGLADQMLPPEKRKLRRAPSDSVEDGAKPPLQSTNPK